MAYLSYAVCCRVWLVHPLYGLGHCGLCRQVPIRCTLDNQGNPV